ncbi:MAG: FAD binding domain-containing protein [Pseudomonadota bacterium]|nr:FAD binding domain-containing protein [Pseudomonadota bacterium]
MLLPKFDYHAPANLEEACQIMAHYGDQAQLLAGGTDLLIALQKNQVSPSQVVALDRVEELKGMGVDDDGLYLGARTTAAEIMDCDFGPGGDALSQAASQVGSPLIRNLATVGGNLATAMPAADMVPPLLVLQASLILQRYGDQREVELKDFFVCPGEQVMLPEEVMSVIYLPRLPEATGSAFEKLGVRKALERSIVSVAAVISLADDNRTVVHARIALGAVAPTPMLATEAAASLIGKKAVAKNFTAAAKIAAQEARPRGLRTSAVYSRLMVETLAVRALTKAFEAARK